MVEVPPAPTPVDQATDLPFAVNARLIEAVELARAAAVEQAGGEPVGEHLAAEPEDGHAATHLFTAQLPGYRGWQWAVTVADGGPDAPVTVSEVVLLPGPDALVSPEWLPWQQRVRPGDLGVGDRLPTELDDPRLVPGYLVSDDPAVEEVALEIGLGRRRVLSLEGRLDAAERWEAAERGADSDMARAAPAACGTCGYFLPLGGSMRGAFGVCGNEFAPVDGTVVGVEYGCGAHSDVEPETAGATPVAELVYDDGVDVEAREPADPQAKQDAAGAVNVVAEPAVNEAAEAAEDAVDVEAPGVMAEPTEVPGPADIPEVVQSPVGPVRARVEWPSLPTPVEETPEHSDQV